MNRKQIGLIVLAAAVVVGIAFYFTNSKKSVEVKQIQINGTPEQVGPANTGDVSPVSGLSCENWNKRPVAVMQPADVQARPAAGFSEADMVIEMPAFTGSVTRLMGVYICNIPKEIGAIRSSRHDYIALASGLDAFFIHWGGSHFALDLLKEKVIDNLDCMSSNLCERWPVSGKMRMEDTGHITKENVLAAFTNLKLRTENTFPGYPHQPEASLEQRPAGGNLRVAFKKPYDTEFDYDKNSNTYIRTWGGELDTDRNNKQQIAPKNVAVLIAASSQITVEQDYSGLRDPWANVEEIKKTGAESITGRYNNVEIGDPWYDHSDSGDAFYYMNGQEIKGYWKKDRSKINSKLTFLDADQKEIKFVPGQIWVDILEPGQALKWTPAN